MKRIHHPQTVMLMGACFDEIDNKIYIGKNKISSLFLSSFAFLSLLWFFTKPSLFFFFFFSVTELLAGDIAQLLVEDYKLSERLDWCYQAAQGFSFSFLLFSFPPLVLTFFLFTEWLGCMECTLLSYIRT